MSMLVKEQSFDSSTHSGQEMNLDESQCLSKRAMEGSQCFAALKLSVSCDQVKQWGICSLRWRAVQRRREKVLRMSSNFEEEQVWTRIQSLCLEMTIPCHKVWQTSTTCFRRHSLHNCPTCFAQALTVGIVQNFWKSELIAQGFASDVAHLVSLRSRSLVSVTLHIVLAVFARTESLCLRRFEMFVPLTVWLQEVLSTCYRVNTWTLFAAASIGGFFVRHCLSVSRGATPRAEIG